MNASDDDILENSDDKFFDLQSPQSPELSRDSLHPPATTANFASSSNGDQQEAFAGDEEEEEQDVPNTPASLVGKAFTGVFQYSKIAMRKTMSFLASRRGVSEASSSSKSSLTPSRAAARELAALALRKSMNDKIFAQSNAAVSSRMLQVCVATWNVAQQVPSESYDIRKWILGEQLTADLDAGIDPPLSSFPDLVVVGLQEAELGGAAILLEVTDASVTWTEAVTDCLNSSVKFRVLYKKIKTLQLVGMSLIVVIRTEHEPFVKNLRASIARTGMKGVLGNKGSLGCRLTLYGKRMLFVCAHFHPHLENAKTRMKNYHDALKDLQIPLPSFADDPFDIISTFDEAYQFLEQRAMRRNGGGNNICGSSLTSLPKASREERQTQGRSAWSRMGFFLNSSSEEEALFKEMKVLEAHDYVFFFGDLNYRLHGVKGPALRAALDNCTEDKRQAILAKHDELIHGMATKQIFEGFVEPPVDFLPTYKYDMGTDQFDTSKKRRDPAWTDRILYRVSAAVRTEQEHQESSASPFTDNVIRVLQYDSVRSLQLSDHKPVVARFELGVNAISQESARTLMAECRDLWDTDHCSEEGHM